MKVCSPISSARRALAKRCAERASAVRCLVSMREKGYRYAIIGWTGPQEFYAKCCGATVIPDSIPASYADLI